MKKLLILLPFFFSWVTSFTQSVSINTDGSLPHPSAILDIKSAVKGMLAPRTSTSSRLAISNPAKGLILYDTTTGGLWIHNGLAWSQLTTDNKTWNLGGNAGSNPVNNFIGTTDNQSLRFRINNAWAGEIHPENGNTFLGIAAGHANTDGNYNTALGYETVSLNTTGYMNTGLGSWALHANTTGFLNTAVGLSALGYNTTGSYNTSIGADALTSNTTGGANTANGATALFKNESGDYNTADGYNALSNNISGYGNTAMGAFSGFNNTTGIYNTAVGVNALSDNTIGTYNTVLGFSSLTNNISGNLNTGIGAQALYFNTSGENNIAIGFNALYGNTTGHHNIAIGNYSGTHPAAPAIYNTVSIGNDGLLNGYQNQVIIGNTSTGFIGGVVTWGVVSDARIKNNVAEDVKGLDFIMRLRPVTYHISSKAITAITGNKETADFPGKYDNEKTKYTGFLAQEVEQAAKASGYDFSGYIPPKNQWGLYTISYEQFVVPLVKAMQEQQAIIVEQQKKLEIMEKRLEILERGGISNR